MGLVRRAVLERKITIVTGAGSGLGGPDGVLEIMLITFIDLMGVADALGLAFFVISGARIAQQLDLPAISVIVMGPSPPGLLSRSFVTPAPTSGPHARGRVALRS